uniref:HIT-type domain-containing protein n=1 Tax=Leersia perrieri TaxID=77586 RepID=A0A0D9WB66_9ORYZ
MSPSSSSSRSSSLVVPVLLLLLMFTLAVVTASATTPAEEAHLLHEEEAILDAADQKKDGAIPAAAESLDWEEAKLMRGGVIATQGDEKSGSSTPPASGGEHGKSEGKEGEKSTKSCVSKEECHKKRLMCGKSCTMSAHTKCANKCSKSCIPTCT